ncbi:MAG: protease complex subunit PrcB family protein [Fimbriimonadales bacterium]
MKLRASEDVIIIDMSLVAAIAAVALGHQIDPNIVIWRTYKAGAYSKASDQEIRVLNTLGDYQQYLDVFQPQGAGNGRDIDWGKEELVAIHIGTRNTGGYSVEVEKIAKVTPNEARISWAELTPVPGVAVTEALTSPWTIVRLNRTGTRITFSGSKREGRLPGGIKIISFPGYDWGCNCCAACVREHAYRLPWREYASGIDAPVMTASTCVMNSPDEYARYVHNYKMDGLGDGSNIDWYRDRLLAIHLGRKFFGGYQILIDHVDIVDQTRVDVSYVQVEPTGRVMRPDTSTGPYLLIRIPRVASAVTFTKRVIRDVDPVGLDTCSCGCATCKYCGRKGR